MGFGRAFSGGFQAGVQSGQESKRAAAAEQARQDQLGFQREELGLAQAAGARAERADVRAGRLSELQLQQGRAALSEQQRVMTRQRQFEADANEALKSGNLESVLQKYPDKAQSVLTLAQTQQQVQTLQENGVDVRRAAGQAYNAMARGDKEGAKAIVRASANIINNAGDPSFTVDRVLDVIDSDPGEAAQMMRGLYTLSGGNAETLLGIKGELTSFQQAQINLEREKIGIDQARALRDAKAKELEAANTELKRQKLTREVAVLDQKILDGETKQKEALATKQAAYDTMFDIVDLANALLGPPEGEEGPRPNLDAITGTVKPRLFTFSEENQNLINVAKRLQALLTADNLDLMTGVLSESDIKIIANVGSALNITDGGILGSTEFVRNELTRIVELTTAAIEKGKTAGKFEGLTPTVSRLTRGATTGTTKSGITWGTQ